LSTISFAVYYIGAAGESAFAFNDMIKTGKDLLPTNLFGFFAKINIRLITIIGSSLSVITLFGFFYMISSHKRNKEWLNNFSN